MNVYSDLLKQEQKQPELANDLTGANKYSEILGKEKDQQMAALRPVLDMAAKVTPAHAVDAQSLSKKTGLPMQFVERNFDELQNREKIMNVQRAMAFSPILSRQLRDPEFAQIAHMDVENLSLIEKTLGVLKNSGSAMLSGLYDASAGTVGVARAGVDTLAPMMDWASGTLLPENPLNRVSAGLAEYQQSIDRSAKYYMPDTTGILDSGFYSGMASLSRNLAFMPMALFGPTGMSAALAGMTLPVFGGEYAKAKDAGRDQFTALGYGASQAVVEYATERLPLTKLVGDLKVGSPFYKLLVKQMLLEVPGEQIATVLQDFNEWMVINPQGTSSDYLRERPSAAGQTLIATVVGVGGQTTVMKGMDMVINRDANDQRRVARAEQEAAVLKQITEISLASKVLEISPSTFEQFMQAATEEGPISSIYIDGQTLMQSGFADAVMEYSPELADQVRVATATGGTVQIPVAEYMTRIAPTEAGNALLDHIKTSPDGFTQTEARDYMVNQAQTLQTEIETAIAEQEGVGEFRASQERVKQNVLEELNTLGRFTESVNEIYATLHATRAATRAAQLGITPEQMFERQRVRFAAARIDGEQFDQALKSQPPKGWVHSTSGQDVVALWNQQSDTQAIFWTDLDGKLAQDAPDLAGYSQSLDRSRVNHIRARHGEESRDGQLSVTEADLARIPDIVQSYDAANTNAMIPAEVGNQTQRGIVLAKEFEDGTVVYSGLVSRGRQNIRTATMWKYPSSIDAQTAVVRAAANLTSETYEGISDILSSDGQEYNQDTQPRDLFVAHNLSAENILAAQDLGGLAAPSIAVGRTQAGFDGFGEVTLLADPDLLNDPKIPTFDADVYSPRQPRAHYKINSKAFFNFTKGLDPDNLGLDAPDINEVSGIDGADAMLRSDGVRLKFLQENNKAPRLKNAKADPLIKRAAKLQGNKYELRDNPKLIKIAEQYYRSKVDQAKASDSARGDRYSSFWFDGDGAILSDAVRDFADQVDRYKQSDGKDVSQYRSDLRDKFNNKKLSTEYQQWVTEHFNSMVEGKTIFKGFTEAGNRRYIPYTMENVVREMTQQIRAGETTFYGAGTVRSAYANELSTLEQIKSRREQIISDADFEKVKDESNKVFADALDKLKPFYKFNADGFGYSEDVGSALTEGPRGLAQAFNVTPEVRQIAADLREYLSNLPTSYFEAKAQRPVQFSEFDTAVVPKGMRKDALQVLKDAGLKIKTYDPKKEGNRTEVVAQQEKLLFQNRHAPRGAYNPETNTVAMLKDADLSTFLHESGHYFFENDIGLAADIVREARLFGYDGLREGEKQILDDVSSLLRWHGIQGNIEAQLADWANMDFEEKRVYHERTAESFELYLMEGKAPSVELQSYFQTFRSWLLNVYKSIKDFLIRNPEAGQLSDEVRTVFDRMLATSEQIELAQVARSMMPLIKTAEDAQKLGLTTDEYEAYQQIGLNADQEAAHDLEVKALGDLKWVRNLRNKTIAKLQKEATSLRKEARIEARREIMSQPVYQAWAFLTRTLEPSDKLALAQRPKAKTKVDPSRDSLFVAIAKLGGVRKAEVVSKWGVDRAERPESGIFGKPVLRATDGHSIDDMRQMLVEFGYLDGNYAASSWDPNEFEERFDSELRGDLQYSKDVQVEALLSEGERAGEGVDVASLMGGRIDLMSLREMGFSEDEVNVLKARRMTATKGLHPDLVSEIPGVNMSSGDELVRALLKAIPPREAIEALTDALMLQKHGELATPEAIEREADLAIHNDARARMVTTEANALNRATGKRNILLPAAKQFAHDLIARLRVRDIKPSVYTSAAAKAGKAAQKAMAQGNIEQAGADKRNQLIQTLAAKAAYEAREEVDRVVKYLTKFGREGTRKAIDPEYVAQIDKMLERFDLRRSQSLTAIDKRTSLADWIAEQEDEGIVPDIPDYLRQEANRTHFKDLTVEQVRGLRDTVQQIEHLGRLKNRLLNTRDRRALDAIVEEITESIETNRPEVVDNEERNTLISSVTHKYRWMMSVHRQLHSLVREMDGYKDGGPLWNVFIRTMNEAGEKEASMRADASRKLHALVKPILAGEKMGGKGKFYPTISRSLNRGEKLAIALNWGNAGNRQRLLDGRGWTEAQILPILETLTEQELLFVQSVWDLFESYRPMVAELGMRVEGKEPDWVEPTPFVVNVAKGQPVEMRGGYYPIKYDPMQSGEASRQDDAEVAKQMLNSAMTAATTRKTYTKSRADKVVGRPVLLTFDGIYQGFNEEIMDLSWREWLIDANKLMRRLDKPIREHFGAQTVKAMQKAIEDIAIADRQPTHAAEKFFQHLRNGSTIVGLGWNVTTSMLQFTGFANSMVRVGTPWVARGIREFYGTPSHMIEKVEEAQEKSEFLRNRMRTMNREINDIQNRLDAGKSDIRMAIESSFFILIQKAQGMVDYPTWYGAYMKALDDPSLVSPDGTIDDAKAVAMADQAVIAAQSGGQVKDLAQIQRGHPAWKLFTNFISYFMTTFQLAAERTNQTNFRKPNEVLALAMDYALLMVLPSVMGLIIRDFMKGDVPDDEEELMERLLAEQISFLMGFSPVLREATSAAQAFAGVDPGFGYSGPAGTRFFSDLYRLGTQINQGELDMPLFKAASNTGGILFHLPAGQVNRMVEGTMALIDGKTSNPLAPLVGVPYER